jgi:predicted amidohydrolase
MSQHLVAACIQTNAASDIETNLQRLRLQIMAAREGGADLIALPENACLMIKDRERLVAMSPHEDDHSAVNFFRHMAEETGAWILAGSIAVATGNGKLANRSLLFSPGGKIMARYDKIHMFDVDLGDGEIYSESASFDRGHQAVIASTPWGGVGLTICYDLRFPYLHRALAKAGAAILTVPSAFTQKTGELHWHALLRARAIENGCFVLAPAQCGVHDGNRRTYGHSLIIAPSGEILAEAGDAPTIIMAELDLDQVTQARSMIPSLQHDVGFTGPDTV